MQPDEMFTGAMGRITNYESFCATGLVEKTRIAPQHFEPMQLLGTGAFGEVYLVRKRSNGIFYAMKVQSKTKIISNNLVKYAQTERNVLSYIEHPFIVNLNYAFQTN